MTAQPLATDGSVEQNMTVSQQNPVLDESLPKLRQELGLHQGATDFHGEPTWSLHDPVRNQYFALDWKGFEILRRFKLGSSEAIIKHITQTTTLQVSADDIESVVAFLQTNELIWSPQPDQTEWLMRRYQAQQKSLLAKLIHNYLFFRVPLLHPDRILDRLLPALSFLFSAWSIRLTGLALLFGLWSVLRDWQAFNATLIDTFSLEGLAGYAAALIVVKIIHEFGHALVAKRLGCRVPTMGIAFLVMFPMAYTDATESWKLPSHRQRAAIASAGIATELFLAAWMLFFWAILPEGTLKGVAFFMATTSLVATLLINASPFMRFDGYFILSDWVRMPNLHPRCFDMARWWLRRFLFRFKDLPPEMLSLGRQRLMVCFAFIVWLYRLVVFIGIALLVYHFFFKALGVVMLFVELWYFVGRPVAREVNVWFERRQEIGTRLTHKPVFYLVLVLLIVFFVPWNTSISTQGILKPERSFNYVLHRSAELVENVTLGNDIVDQGSPLLILRSMALDEQIALASARMIGLQRQLATVSVKDQTRAQQALLSGQLEAAVHEYEGLILESARLLPVAPFAGEIVDVKPNLQPGQVWPRGEHLFSLVDKSQWVVDAYVEEGDLLRINVGNRAKFLPDSAGQPKLALRVIAIDPDTTRVLSEPALGSLAGGRLLVREQDGKLLPERAVYRVRLAVEQGQNALTGSNLRGTVSISAWPRSLFGELLRGAGKTLLREFGF